MSFRFLPNLLTLLRMVLTAPICLLLLRADFELALLLCFVAGFSDGLDGWLAQRFGWESRLGRLLDPLADKVMLVSITITLWWIGLMPWWATLAVAGRDAIIIAGVMVVARFFRHLDARPTWLGKWNTALQILVVFLVLLDVTFVPLPLPLLQGMFVLLAVGAFLSGADYFRTGLLALLRREDPLADLGAEPMLSGGKHADSP